MSHAVVILKWQGLGYAPLIVGPGGAVLTVVLAWTIAEKRKGKSDSTLYRQVHAVRRFAEFWEHYHVRLPPVDLYHSCFESLVHGDKRLGWDRVGPTTASRCLENVNRYVSWAVDRMGVIDPNPMIVKHEGWVATLAQIDHQMRTRMLGHLAPATRAGRGMIERRSIHPAKTSKRMSAFTVGQASKAMGWDDYVTLLHHERSTRNLLLWLMLGAGGLRVSEAVHLYVQDVSSTYDGQARVLLADPRYGQIAVPSRNGEMRVMTREAYLKEYFGLTTRDQLRLTSTLYAGWKGMRVHDGKAMTAEIIWMHPDFGKLAWAAHKHYLRTRRCAEPNPPKHPYYFTSLERNTGAPLSIANAKSLLRDACARLGIESATNLHSLRHMFGETLHNRGGVELDKVQVAMRHKDRSSTEIYTRPMAEMVRERLKEIDGLRPEIQGTHEEL